MKLPSTDCPKKVFHEKEKLDSLKKSAEYEPNQDNK